MGDHFRVILILADELIVASPQCCVAWSSDLLNLLQRWRTLQGPLRLLIAVSSLESVPPLNSAVLPAPWLGTLQGPLRLSIAVSSLEQVPPWSAEVLPIPPA